MVRYFEISRPEYRIPCKLFVPDKGDIDQMILGIHGLFGSKESWTLTELGEASIKKGIGLTCFDLPCHGKSSAKKLTVSDSLADIRFVYKWICSEFPHAKQSVFATSYGGFLVLNSIDLFKDAKIVLRSPAISMPEHILRDMLDCSIEEFKTTGYIMGGYDGKIKLPYSFYEELQNYKILDKSFDKEMLVLHGDLDQVVPRSEILTFCVNSPKIYFKSIPGADHSVTEPEIIQDFVTYTLDWLR